MAKKKSKLKLIALDEKNYQALKNHGRTADSFNDVVTTILKNLNKNNSSQSEARIETPVRTAAIRTSANTSGEYSNE